MEVSDCSDPTNGFDAISKDFAKMKTLGATLVRVYAPQCGKVSVWENLVKAGVTNNSKYRARIRDKFSLYVSI